LPPVLYPIELLRLSQSEMAVGDGVFLAPKQFLQILGEIKP
jgi:hypothetical protein